MRRFQQTVVDVVCGRDPKVKNTFLSGEVKGGKAVCDVSFIFAISFSRASRASLFRIISGSGSR